MAERLTDAEAIRDRVRDVRRWTGCVAGTPTRDEYERHLRAAGLVKGDVSETHRAHASAARR